MVDLLARVPATAVPEGGIIRDLGCGHGRLTAMLADRWPSATVTGVDSSDQMLAVARADHDRPSIAWQHGDLLVAPDAPVDLLVSNAALHWVDDHRTLFPRLVAWLAPGGTLAVQMPRNHDAPTHRVLADLALDARWRDRLLPVLRPYPVAPPTWLHDLLRPLTATLDVWETTYIHALTGDDPILTWVSGSVLRPLLAALATDDERDAFTTEAAARYRDAHPMAPDGTTLLPFTRQFLVATV